MHGYAEEGIRLVHGRFSMGDNDKLRFFREAFEIGSESIHVRVVERRFDFVEDTERHGMRFQNREQNRNRRQRAFTARKQGDFRELFPRRASHDFDTRRERVFPFDVVDLQFRSTATEEFFEGNFEVLVDLLEARVEDTEHFRANLVERGLQIVERFLQVFALGKHFVTMRFFVLVLFHGVGIHRAEHGDLAFECGNRLRALFHVVIFNSIRQTALVVKLVRFLYAQAQVFEVGVDFADLQLALIPLVRLLGKVFLQLRAFLFERELARVDFLFFFGNGVDLVHDCLYRGFLFLGKLVFRRLRFHGVELGLRFGAFVFHVENAFYEVLFLHRKAGDRFHLRFHRFFQSDVFHFHLAKERALFVPLFLEGFALATLGRHLRFRVATTGTQFLFGKGGIGFFELQIAKFQAEFFQRLRVGFDIAFRFRDLLHERGFALRKPRDFAVCFLVFIPKLVHRLLRGFEFLFALGDRRFELFDILLFLGDILATFLYLAFARKQRPRLTTATARHRTARSNNIPLDRYDSEHIAVLFRNHRRVIDVVAYERVPKQVGNDVVIIIVVVHELARQTHRTALVQRALDLARVGTGAHHVHGQEGNDTHARTAQIIDEQARVVRRRRYYVLHCPAERRFDRHFVFLLGGDDIRHDATQMFPDFGVGFRHRQQSAHGIFIALETVFQTQIHFQVLAKGGDLSVRVEKFLVEVVDRELQFPHFFLPFLELAHILCVGFAQTLDISLDGSKLVAKPFFLLLRLFQGGF